MLTGDPLCFLGGYKHSCTTNYPMWQSSWIYILGWAIDEHMKTTLCIKALQMAYWRNKPPSGLLHHSDRGCQYASYAYKEQLKLMKMEQRMSRKGDCWDNSPMERFFRSLKYEHLNYQKFSSKAAAKLSVID
jgi:putative transposase